MTCEHRSSGTRTGAEEDDEMVTFTRAGPSDIVTLGEMIKRSSDRSRLRRFFRPVSSAPSGYLEEILADGDNHHAFVMRRNSETIGLAELHLTASRSGDVGLIVEDRLQGKGIGSLALRLLVCRARELGLGQLTADVQRENVPAVRALRRVGSTTVRQEYGVLHFELDLIVAESSRAATRPGAASSPVSDSGAPTDRELAA